MMSRAIPANDGAVRFRVWRAFPAGFRIAFALLVMLCSQTASADPAKAEFHLQQAKIDYQMFNQLYQQGKYQAQTGQIQAARNSFSAALVKSIALSVDLQVLASENRKTLAQGQCRDCVKQEWAISYNDSASAEAYLLRMHMEALYQSPASQQWMSRVEYQRMLVNFDMLQTEQAMLAAQ